MTLEPRVAAIVRIFKALDRADPDMPMVQQRIASAKTARQLGWIAMPHGPATVRSVDRLLPVDGGRITVRLHRPPGTGPLPLHVFFHGGGWCIGTLDERDPRCRVIADGAGCVVASVDYRMAPENTYPTAPEDCYAALTWLVAHAAELDVDAERVSVGGESAGGNLAAVVAQMARDRGGPALRFQWLDVPATDLTLSQPSYRELPDGYLLDRSDIVRYREHYLADPGQMTEPYASPLFATDFSGLPAAFVTTCGYDHLRDDGEQYALRLTEAGVPAEHVRLPGHVHPSFAFTRLVRSAAAHERRAVAALAASYR